jgi:hypothetical protein
LPFKCNLQRYTVAPAGPQFGGHVTNYGNRLSFVTVHGGAVQVESSLPIA